MTGQAIDTAVLLGMAIFVAGCVGVAELIVWAEDQKRAIERITKDIVGEPSK